MSKKNLFLILLAFVIFSGIVYWIYKESTFSKEILRLDILGPENAKAGDEITYTVKYKNNGNFVLQKVKLVFIMPDNSLTEDGKTRISQDLKDIYPGNEESIEIKTRLLGKENDTKTARASIIYVPKNLTASFESDTSFVTKLDETPVTLGFDLPSKAEKGKDLQFSINYFSNIDYPLEKMSIKLDPVAGFDFKSSTPSSLDNSEWKLSTLNKAQGGRITIKGTVTGDTDKNLVFNASLGMWQNGSFIAIKQTTVEVQVISPLLSITQQINGSANYVASPGETLRYQIFFRNIGNTPFDNLFVIVKLDGQALDMSTIQPGDGQAQPNDNMIVWSSQQSSQLRSLGVQEEGSVSFSVKLKTDWNTSGGDKNNIVVTDQVNVSQITQSFSVKVNSGLVISQQAYFSNSSADAPDSGPIPPKVGKATTYTIVWDVKNYFSDTKNAKVKAVLPKNVTLTGKIFPQDESSNFSFDSKSREIVWSAGDVLAGTGVRGDPMSLSFQVSLVPLASQKGSTAPLIGSVSVSGENQFTNTIITSTSPGKDTGLEFGYWPDQAKAIVQ